MFKDSKYAAECRREQLYRDVQPVPEFLINLYSSRQARIGTSVIGIVGFFVLVANSLIFKENGGYVVLVNWLLMGLSFPLFSFFAKRRTKKCLLRLFSSSEDVYSDIAKIERITPVDFLMSRATRLEAASLMLPMISLSLLAPLSLHLLIGSTVFMISLDFFDQWVLISLLLVGHAHLTLLVFSIMHVVRIQRDLDRGAVINGAGKGFWALLWTVAASAIPGVVLLCIPPLLVAFTGLIFVPWMFQWASERAQAERIIIDSSSTGAEPGPMELGGCLEQQPGCQSDDRAAGDPVVAKEGKNGLLQHLLW